MHGCTECTDGTTVYSFQFDLFIYICDPRSPPLRPLPFWEKNRKNRKTVEDNKVKYYFSVPVDKIALYKDAKS